MVWIINWHTPILHGIHSEHTPFLLCVHNDTPYLHDVHSECSPYLLCVHNETPYLHGVHCLFFIHSDLKILLKISPMYKKRQCPLCNFTSLVLTIFVSVSVTEREIFKDSFVIMVNVKSFHALIHIVACGTSHSYCRLIMALNNVGRVPLTWWFLVSCYVLGWLKIPMQVFLFPTTPKLGSSLQCKILFVYSSFLP